MTQPFDCEQWASTLRTLAVDRLVAVPGVPEDLQCRKVINDVLQREFDILMCDLKTLETDHHLHQEQQQEQRMRQQCHFRHNEALSFMRLLGYLGKSNIVHRKVVGHVLHELIGADRFLPSASHIQFACALIRTTGPCFSKRRFGQALLNSCMSRIQSLSEERLGGFALYSESVMHEIEAVKRLDEDGWPMEQD
eukprot:TRINITY_DN22076_c0_g1_i1.p1 TRINITY_DN22076_c0_g1~~TRINITY_DN22076_c0_g1_i1.p1  ORF type:complete len:212 (-),score=22.35 TRINITY_DN22076_c0_g1_i1:20-601(-)